jgi:hypothetical protein
MLRKNGHCIDENAEDEQAHVIHWMLSMYVEHGGSWRETASEFLRGATSSESKSTEVSP